MDIATGITSSPSIRPQVVALVASLSPGLRMTAPTLTDGELAAVLEGRGWVSWGSVLRTLS